MRKAWQNGHGMESDGGRQLDLFGVMELKHEDTFDALRLPGRETLAEVLPETGRGTGGDGPLAGCPAGGGRTDRWRGGLAAPALDPAGVDAPASPRPGLGDRAGTLPPDTAGALTPTAEPAETEPLRNQANYRITDADRVGAGSLKQKCRANLDAIELLKQLEAEGRPASDTEKRVLVRYVGWGGLPQVFDQWNEQWQEERERL